MDFHVVLDALNNTLTQIAQFIPRLINGLIVLVIGYLLAWIVRWLLRTVLRRLRFNQLMERAGIVGALRGVGVRLPLSELIAQVIFVFLLLSFLITSTRLMGLEAVAVLLERLLGFFPNAVSALIVFLIGGLVARFLGDLIATLAAAEGVGFASRLGRLLRYLIMIFVAVLAMAVLGLDTALLVTVVTIMVAAVGLALSLALGLGMRPVAFQVFAGYYIRQRFPAGQRITVDGLRGEVSSVGSVNTVVSVPSGAYVVPNGVLLESIVETSPSTPQTQEPPVATTA